MIITKKITSNGAIFNEEHNIDGILLLKIIK